MRTMGEGRGDNFADPSGVWSRLRAQHGSAGLGAERVSCEAQEGKIDPQPSQQQQQQRRRGRWVVHRMVFQAPS